MAVLIAVIVALVVAGGIVIVLNTGRSRSADPRVTPSPPVSTLSTPPPSVPPAPKPTAFAAVNDPERPAALVLDGDPATFWATPAGKTPKSPDAWIAVDLGGDFPCVGLSATPAPDGAYFPTAYRIQTSDDNVTWTDVPGQVYNTDNQIEPVNGVLTYKFEPPVIARYIRILADVMTGARAAISIGGYRMALAEMSVLTG
jgi:hypothetical protein